MMWLMTLCKSAGSCVVVDLSSHSQEALENALSLASAYDAEVTVLHFFEDRRNPR